MKNMFFYAVLVIAGLFITSCKAKCDCTNCQTEECCASCATTTEQVTTDSTAVPQDTVAVEAL